jgi:hypothetical protein
LQKWVCNISFHRFAHPLHARDKDIVVNAMRARPDTVMLLMLGHGWKSASESLVLELLQANIHQNQKGDSDDVILLSCPF